MHTYGTFPEALLIDGVEFRSDRADEATEQRAGLHPVFALNGLPPRFEEALIRAAQVSDVPHTWRLQECASEDEVPDEVVTRGREVLARDQREMNAHIITYVTERAAGEYEFLAAGAIRNKLTRDYENSRFPVVSRAIVSPRHRGKGLGTFIVTHRIRAAMHIFGELPKAIHFGTESRKVVHSAQRVAQEDGIRFVYIGDEQYTASDGTHTVHDYLCFLPWYQAELENACKVLGRHSKKPHTAEIFWQGLETFMSDGIAEMLGAELAQRYTALTGTLDQAPETARAREVIDEVFFVKQKIGALDPRPKPSAEKEPNREEPSR